MVSSTAFETALAGLPDLLELDLQAVTFLDSAGMAVLIRPHWQRCVNGGSFRIVEPSRAIRRVLEIIGLLDLLTGRRPGPAAPARPTLNVVGPTSPREP